MEFGLSPLLEQNNAHTLQFKMITVNFAFLSACRCYDVHVIVGTSRQVISTSQHHTIPASNHPSISASQPPIIPALKHPSIPVSTHPSMSASHHLSITESQLHSIPASQHLSIPASQPPSIPTPSPDSNHCIAFICTLLRDCIIPSAFLQLRIDSSSRVLLRCRGLRCFFRSYIDPHHQTPARPFTSASCVSKCFSRRSEG